MKSVNELISPLSGRIRTVNDALTNDPSLVNTNPCQADWLFAVEPAQATLESAPADLLDAQPCLTDFSRSVDPAGDEAPERR